MAQRNLPTDTLGADEAHELPSQLRLLVVAGPDEGKQALLQRGTYFVGKAPDCDLTITDGAVSRRHLQVTVLPNGVTLRDLDSKNGSAVDGTRFREVVAGAGAIITIGATTLKLAAVDESPPLPASTARRFGPLLGRALPMRQLFGLLERSAGAGAAMLIDGESGTGKSLCAEALHAASGRGPLETVRLRTLAPALVEATLFDAGGAWSRARGGTLVLDEVGALDTAAQARLGAALADNEDRAVRVLALTQRDLAAAAAAGDFERALYERLAVVRATLPPLRQRKGDIPHLLRHFAAGRTISITSDALALLHEYDWPGNVRELRSVVERGLSLARPGDRLTPKLLGLSEAALPRGAPRGYSAEEGFHAAKEQLIGEWERAYLTELLQRAGGNVSRAARDGGLDRPYLYRLLRKHGLHGGHEG